MRTAKEIINGPHVIIRTSYIKPCTFNSATSILSLNFNALSNVLPICSGRLLSNC